MAKGNPEAVKKASELVGGRQNLAIKVGVSYKTLLDWTSGRSGMTVINAIKIEKITEGQITKKDLLPDFPWEDLEQEK